MEAALEFRSTDSPAEHEMAAVEAGLERHNHTAAPLGDVRPVAAFATDASGRIVGGATGRWWGSCCELLQLWVNPAHRARGVGSRLLAQFEAHARSHGCRIFYLTTLSYQAPDFYRRHGYAELARIDGYPDGIAKFLFHKTLP